VQEDRSVAYTAGWYPDPVGVHELRYHNGVSWTGDVSTDGVRHVSPIPPAPAAERSGTAALVLGIVSLCIGWIPFVSVVGFGTAIAAVVIGLRRRRFPSARSASDAGIVMGATGIVFAIVGTWLAFLVVDAVADYEDPGSHTVELTACAEVDGITRADGTITNLDDSRRSYTVEVRFDDDRSDTVEVDDVGPGDTASFVVEQDLRFDDLDCQVASVKGPRPFGLRLDT
jgi:hypothetical protein